MPMLDQVSVLKLITRRLDVAGIPYMVTGSIAAGLYGQPRMTRDIDLVVHVEPADAERLAAAVGEELSPDPDAMRAAIATPDVDCLGRGPHPFQTAVGARQRLRAPAS